MMVNQRPHDRDAMVVVVVFRARDGEPAIAHPTEEDPFGRLALFERFRDVAGLALQAVGSWIGSSIIGEEPCESYGESEGLKRCDLRLTGRVEV
jgi:hypothetical protein